MVGGLLGLRATLHRLARVRSCYTILWKLRAVSEEGVELLEPLLATATEGRVDVVPCSILSSSKRATSAAQVGFGAQGVMRERCAWLGQCAPPQRSPLDTAAV